jgi:outer membrane protein OmpA-like peptidoglycan-associated protein
MSAKNHSFWISLSDVMTGLMIVFMFIAISFIRKVRQDQENQNRIVTEFRDTQLRLYKALDLEFRKDFESTQWQAELGEDLTIRFQNPQVLFDYNQDDLKPQFTRILDNFFPRYLAILLQPEFRDKILEVRIEGHTDSQGGYLFNVALSQRRTLNVLEHLLVSPTSPYRRLGRTDQELIRYWFTANGFSYGRTLDSEGNETITSRNAESPIRSRRVEFRIVTKSDEVLKQIVNELGLE